VWEAFSPSCWIREIQYSTIATRPPRPARCSLATVSHHQPMRLDLGRRGREGAGPTVGLVAGGALVPFDGVSCLLMGGNSSCSAPSAASSASSPASFSSDIPIGLVFRAQPKPVFEVPDPIRAAVGEDVVDGQ
jgi:hypothetical protein